MDSNLKPFGISHKDNLDDWVFVIDSFLELKRVPETTILLLITPLLKGRDLTLLKKFRSENPHETLETFREVLKKAFENCNGSKGGSNEEITSNVLRKNFHN